MHTVYWGPNYTCKCAPFSCKQESGVDVRVMQGRTTLQAGQKKRKDNSVQLKIKGVMSVGKKTLRPFFHFLLPWTIKCRSTHLSPLFVSDTDQVATQILTLSVCCEVPVISPLLVYSAGGPPIAHFHREHTARRYRWWKAFAKFNSGSRGGERCRYFISKIFRLPPTSDAAKMSFTRQQKTHLILKGAVFVKQPAAASHITQHN